MVKRMTYTLVGTVAFFETGDLQASVANAASAAEAVGGVMLAVRIPAHWIAPALSPILIGVVLAAYENKGTRRNRR